MAALFSFGEWLRQRRSALLLSREELARQVGCPQVTLRKIEADQRLPSLAIAERLAERLLFLQVARGRAGADSLPSPIPRGARSRPNRYPRCRRARSRSCSPVSRAAHTYGSAGRTGCD